MPKRRVLGIDPGVGRCGWAVVTVERGRETLEASGCITTSAKKTPADRLLALDRELEKIIVDLRPESLAIEKIFFSKNITTAMGVSQARGIILLTAARHHLIVLELSPTTVKNSITGYGRATKRDIAQMIKLLLHLPPGRRTDDEYDAIGIALTGAHQLPRL